MVSSFNNLLVKRAIFCFLKRLVFFEVRREFWRQSCSVQKQNSKKVTFILLQVNRILEKLDSMLMSFRRLNESIQRKNTTKPGPSRYLIESAIIILSYFLPVGLTLWKWSQESSPFGLGAISRITE